MAGNGYGSHLTTRERDMAAHDASPRWVRDIANYAVAKLGGAPLRREALALAEFASVRNARRMLIGGISHAEAEDCYRYYGPDHPEADCHGRKLKPVHCAAWSRRPR